MGTVISPDGRFEWDEEKNTFNKENHGFYFEEILNVFNDPFFMEAYDREHSTFSARLAEPFEKERYDENYQKQVAGYG